jgi:hypothetical protein
MININQPPPPTPCSTDNFEESDSQVAYHSSPSPSSIPNMGPGIKSAGRRQQSSQTPTIGGGLP